MDPFGLYCDPKVDLPGGGTGSFHPPVNLSVAVTALCWRSTDSPPVPFVVGLPWDPVPVAGLRGGLGLGFFNEPLSLTSLPFAVGGNLPSGA